MIRILLVALVVATGFARPGLAVLPDEVLKDPALEERAREISKDLRCLVCQNQSIDDSDAGLARDLRVLVRERLVAGDSNDEVKSYIVERYGDFVLLTPPFNSATFLLWFGPVFFLMCAVIFAGYTYRRHATPGRDADDLDAEQRRRIDALTGDGDEDGDRRS